MEVVIAGASGLVGQRLLERLLALPACSRVWSIGRRRLRDAPDDRLREVVVDFERPADIPAEVRGDHAYCCLGTTIATAGSQEAFRRVDLDYVHDFAALMKRRGTKKFMLVSALGADANSRVFYNRVKGEAEAAVAALGFEASHVVRPSFLMGDREVSRPGEKLGIGVARLISPLLVGGMRKMRPVAAADVAGLLLSAAASDDNGHHVHFCH